MLTAIPPRLPPPSARPRNADFLEEYALNPESRQGLVDSCLIGTAEHYMFKLRLFTQQLQDPTVPVTAERIAEAMAFLKAAEDSGYLTQNAIQMHRAQFALLAFKVEPDLLRKELAFKSSKALPIDSSVEQDAEELDICESLPTVLDQTQLKTDTLIARLLEELVNDTSTAIVPTLAWSQLLVQPEIRSVLLEKVDPVRLSKIFSNMDIMLSPDSAGIIGQTDASRVDELVVDIIVRLVEHQQLDFSNSSQYTRLTTKQLQWIQERLPGVTNNEAFVGLQEMRILPKQFVGLEEHRNGYVQREWLDRMMDFVDPLSPKFNRHKLSVYLMGLEIDLAKGIMDKDKFKRYIAIPRNHTHCNDVFLKNVAPDQVVYFDSVSTLPFWSNRIQLATKERDDEIISEYLAHFLQLEKSTAEYEEFFEVKSFLNPLLARVMLTSGDKDTRKWSALLGPHEDLSKLTEQTILRFDRNNPETFLPSDPVAFRLKVKNARRILVRVFEVKTLEYLQQHEGVVGQELNLDGLTPNWEHHLVLDHPPLEMHSVLIELPELAGRRGAFIMDVICNGENSSIYFTKGHLDFIERHSVAGHVLTVIDENQRKVTQDVSIWYRGYHYKTNDDGDIVIPYAPPAANHFIYITLNDFTTRKAFLHKAEHYSMDLSWHIDNESLIAGAMAKILLKPIVMIRGTNIVCPVDLLDQVELEVEYCDTNGTSTTITKSDFKIYDADWSEYSFQVSENFSTLEVTLSARLKELAPGSFQQLTASMEYNVEGNNTDKTVSVQANNRVQTVQIHGEIHTVLQKTTRGYQILVLGKNGEKRPNIPLAIEITHPLWDDSFDFQLRSNKNGLIDLGLLTDVSTINCSTTDIRWNLAKQARQCYPSTVHAIAGESIQLPLSREDISFVRTVALFKSSPHTAFNWPLIKDCTSHAKLHDGLLRITDLEPGCYALKLAEVRIDLVIAGKPATAQKIAGLEAYSVESNPMLQVLDSTKNPLYVQAAIANDENQTVDIQLRNWTAATRVCITATKFVPSKPMFKDLFVQSPETPWSMQKGGMTKTVYRTGRVLGEEYQYVLNRKAQTNHWAGNLLTKPSVLLTPWSVGETTMSKQELEGGSAFTTTTNAQGGTPFGFGNRGLGKGGAKRHRKILPPGGPPPLAFMVHPSAVLANLVPDQSTGLLRLPYAALKEASYLQICVTDNSQGLQLSLVVPSRVQSDFEKKDLRFRSALQYDKHYIGERSGVNLDPNRTAGTDATPSSSEPSSVTLASNGSSASAVRIINSVGQLYDLMMTLLKTSSHKQHLRKFGFIVDWHRLSPSAKDDRYSKWNCHELNLFLYKKDRKYFDAVVTPYIKNKLVKSFMDDYLIGASLEKYTTLREFSLLTCLEKCLLAQRVPRLRSSVSQWIRSRVRNIKVAHDIKLFRTVMNSGALQEIGAESTDESREMDVDSKAAGMDEDGNIEEDDDGTSEESDWEEVDEDMGFELAGSGSRSVQPSGDQASSSFGGFGSNARAGLFGSSLAFGAAAAVAAPPAPPPPPPAFGQSQQQQSTSLFGFAPQAPIDHRAAREQSSKILQKQFKPVDLTKEKAETYYWGRRDFATECDKLDVNAFWLDYVEWDESRGRSFLSQNFVTNTETFTSAMATIALMDVQFAPRDASVKRTVDSNLVVTSMSPAIVFHSSTKELQKAPITGSLLATQRYFEVLDYTEMDPKLMTRVQKYISPGAALRPMISYGAHVVLMNATSNPMNLHVEIQLPQGSISINSPLEAGQDITLGAHGTFQYEYHFYFPEAGDFLHYPVHVSDYEDIVAFAEPSVLEIRAPEPGNDEKVDTTTWQHVLRSGDQSAVLRKLKADPLDGMDVELLIPRLYKDRELFKNVTAVLRDRHEYNSRIWSVSLAWKDEDEIVREYVEHQPIATQVGNWFTSPLLDRRPRNRYEAGASDAFHYLEYFPLINARAHKATRHATILNDRFKTQYDKFLSLLSEKPQHEPADLLVLVVYLLAQDRILEAKDYFLKLTMLLQESSVSLEGHDYQQDRLGFQQIQYDYLRAYLSLCVEVQVDASAADLALDLEGVERILARYQKYPVERWNRLFKDMRDYVKEIKSTTLDKGTVEGPGGDVIMTDADRVMISAENDTEDRDDHIAITEDFAIGSDGEISVRHRGVEQIMIEYYAIDAETMFSNSPFTFSEQGESETNTAASSAAKTNGASSEPVSNSYRLVKPNAVDRHVVEQQQQRQSGASGSQDGLLKVPILPQYRNTNVMISLSTVPPAATRTWRAYYSQTILVQCQELSGIIKVVTKAEEQEQSQGKHSSCQQVSRPIRGAYVKVYAEMKTGSTTFWRDGYTDLVGRFAYATVSSSAVEPSTFGQKISKGGLGEVKRFVAFVDGGKDGCMVKTLPVPPV